MKFIFAVIFAGVVLFLGTLVQAQESYPCVGQNQNGVLFQLSFEREGDAITILVDQRSGEKWNVDSVSVIERSAGDEKVYDQVGDSQEGEVQGFQLSLMKDLTGTLIMGISPSGLRDVRASMKCSFSP